MRKMIVWAEMITVFSLIMAQIWVTGRQSIVPAILALVIIAASWKLRKENMASLGLLASPEKRGLRVFTLVLLVLSCAIIAARIILEAKITPHLGSTGIAMGLLAYFPWALFQQLILNGYFAKRLSTAIGNELYAAAATGILFSVAHFPNPLLMLVTLGGAASSFIFFKMKNKNLYLLAAAQVAISMTIFLTVPASVHHNFRVGPGFHKWHP